MDAMKIKILSTKVSTRTIMVLLVSWVRPFQDARTSSFSLSRERSFQGQDRLYFVCPSKTTSILSIGGVSRAKTVSM
jgi:hypothetical protein